MRFVRGRVLDIGSGAGRHSLYLQGKGYEVVAIDNSPLALEVCRQRGLRNTKQVPISRKNSGLGIFDTVLMMGNNFGLFGSYDWAKRSLKKLHKIMSGQARIIATSNEVYHTEAPEHLAYHERNRERGRMGGQIRLRVRYRMYRVPGLTI